MKFSKDFLEKHGIAESELESINKIVSDNPIDIYDLEESVSSKILHSSKTHTIKKLNDHYQGKDHIFYQVDKHNTPYEGHWETTQHKTLKAACKKANVNHEDIKEDIELDEKYEGFKKLEGELKAKGDKNPGGLAAYIGRKKYGKENFDKHAEEGKKFK